MALAKNSYDKCLEGTCCNVYNYCDLEIITVNHNLVVNSKSVDYNDKIVFTYDECFRI